MRAVYWLRLAAFPGILITKEPRRSQECIALGHKLADATVLDDWFAPLGEEDGNGDEGAKGPTVPNPKFPT